MLSLNYIYNQKFLLASSLKWKEEKSLKLNIY